VNREEMVHGAELLGVPFDEHLQIVIDAMAEIADDLGLAGAEAQTREAV
jgi:predicted hydrolase (HD superfamily)